MANITIYKVEEYSNYYKKIFTGVYNDFKNNAATDYDFELSPLDYEHFTKSIEDGLLNCLILFEDDIPTGFLVYTTIISEAIELNIIHCIGNENLNAKRKLLLVKFIETVRPLMKDKVITYPMLGKQNSFTDEIKDFGFQVVNTSVMGFNLTNISAINTAKEFDLQKLPKDYSVTNWKATYFKEAADIIHQAFKESSDALYDSRFLTVKGCKDILEKITDNIYGRFLPEITKVLIYKKHPVGVCFANLTGETIANIPICAILKEHRNSGFGKILLKQLIDNLLTTAITKGWLLKEINASCDSDNRSAVGMYSSVGFTEEYTYAQAYHPKTN